jgi:hypothetical protein
LADAGSLLDNLKSPAARTEFGLSTLCSFAQQIAAGMCYLVF